MGVRTEWSQAFMESPEVVDYWRDAYGSTLEPGNVALVLGCHSAFVIEAITVDEIRDLARKVLAECDRFEQESGQVDTEHDEDLDDEDYDDDPEDPAPPDDVIRSAINFD